VLSASLLDDASLDILALLQDASTASEVDVTRFLHLTVRMLAAVLVEWS
jgi:hypothetical protein